MEDFIRSKFATKSKFKWDFHSKISNLRDWQVYSSIFDKWIESNDKKCNAESLIPKIIHHIWLGEKDLPSYFKIFKKTWLKNNPEYEFFFWDDKECKKLNLFNQELFDSVNNPGSKSDILRYEILYKYGGIYIDTDFECIKPIPNELLKKSFVACMQFSYSPEIGNAILMSEPKSDLILQLIKSCSSPGNESVRNIIKNTGPDMITNQICKNIDSFKNKILILPSNYCYPKPSFLKDIQLFDELITKDSFAIHHWTTTWMRTNKIKKLKIIIESFIKSFLDLIVK